MDSRIGRVTIPTDLDVIPQTLELMGQWGADAVRDCDGTDFPQELRDVDAKIYSTYYTTRKDNECKSRGNSADVCHDAFLYGRRGELADSADERAVPRYAKAQQPG